MASYFTLTLDTLAPSGVSIAVHGGILYTASTEIQVDISCSDVDKSGYTMKIWGSVDGATTESQAQWQAYSATKIINLTSGDGLKTIYCKVRDAVWNETSAVSTTITLNTDIPVVTITGPDVDIISLISGKNTSIMNFTASSIFDEYKVKLVPAGNSAHDAGVIIGTVGGSSNTSGSAGNYPADTNIQVTIKGSDLQTAAGGSDGSYIIKTFVKNKAGTWSA